MYEMKGSKGQGFKEAKEKSMGMLKGANLKYGGQFDNPEKLLNKANGLADYVKKNQNKK